MTVRALNEPELSRALYGRFLRNCDRSRHRNIGLKATAATEFGSFDKFNSTLGTVRRDDFPCAIEIGATAATELDPLCIFTAALRTKSHGNYLPFVCTVNLDGSHTRPTQVKVSGRPRPIQNI